MWVLHRRPWRESSLLIDLLSVDHGRLAVVAKGARGARSPWRGLAEPFMPLRADWSKRGEMGTLVGLEADGARFLLQGRQLWCGLYANELLIRLLGRDDPCPDIHGAYGRLLLDLRSAASQAASLRRFEIALLGDLGVVPDLLYEASSGDAVVPEGRYYLEPESGVLHAHESVRHSVSGRGLLVLAGQLAPDPASAAEARQIARRLIDHQLAGQPLKTRELFRAQDPGTVQLTGKESPDE